MRRSEKRKSEKKEDAGARQGTKVAIDCVFPTICGSGGSKSRLAKAAGAVVRNTYSSQHVQSTPCSDHFWKLRGGRKSARRCGAKHISKSKIYKTHHVQTTFES